MINKQEDVNPDLDSFDPRIVQTVRGLKSKPFRHSDNTVTNQVVEENKVGNTQST
jgi:hypothetical protein